MREHHPALMARARRYLLLPDYIAYRLTGRAVTDPCTASSTGLYAEDAPDYCMAALSGAGIDKSQVAEIQTTGRPIGKVLKKSAEQWGLTTETLVVTGTNDQYSGALGAGNCRPGIVSMTTGTCLALVTLTEHLPSPCLRGSWEVDSPFLGTSLGSLILNGRRGSGLVPEGVRSRIQPSRA